MNGKDFYEIDRSSYNLVAYQTALILSQIFNCRLTVIASSPVAPGTTTFTARILWQNQNFADQSIGTYQIILK